MSRLWTSAILQQRRTTTRRPENYNHRTKILSTFCIMQYASFLLILTASAIVILLAHTSIISYGLCHSAVLRTRSSHSETAAVAVSRDPLENTMRSSSRDQDSPVRQHNEQEPHDDSSSSAGKMVPLPTTTNFSGILARSFESWTHPLPCFEPEQDWPSLQVQKTPAETGFLYVKPYKTGSSTTSGINLRIARNVALRNNANFEICRGEYFFEFR